MTAIAYYNKKTNCAYYKKCKLNCDLCKMIYEPRLLKKQKVSVEDRHAEDRPDRDDVISTDAQNGDEVEVKIFPIQSPLAPSIPTTTNEVKMDDIKLDETPNLIRSLSEQHWREAEVCLLQTKCEEAWAGAFYGLNQGDEWNYWVSRRGKTLVRHSRSTNGSYSESVMPLPRPKRCGGKTVTDRRCKNKCYGNFCSRHQKSRLSPCSYIV